MKAYVFPGQGSQFVGMGKDLFDKSPRAKEYFLKANTLLKFKITDLMFDGTEEDLKQTNVTQPAVFLHSVCLAIAMGDAFVPDLVAGHSLGEFSALVANKSMSFEDGLRLVSKRAQAMQKACEMQPSTMAAILGLPDSTVEMVCASIKNEIVVPANYNGPDQIVISGSVEGVALACEKMLAAGAKRALPLKVGGAFHSPLMEPARLELAEAIASTKFARGICPIYQNVTGQSVTDPEIIKKNLIAQLTSPVRWTHIMSNMIASGVKVVVEVGPGNVLQGMFKKIDRNIITQSASV
ncbi:MAG: ACP S-malonyltransferase [Bacteroidales bacterium]|nr:ACP S-malonyltransferase [Bacteroidales bacterium]